jgi:hypothetical protein
VRPPNRDLPKNNDCPAAAEPFDATDAVAVAADGDKLLM